MPPIKLAIVGGGPSAFYLASRLLSLLPKTDSQGSNLRVHVYDRLWAPHGLVRYGVAPDHPEVKNATHKFDQAAADERFRFFGNIQVGAQSPPSIPHALRLPLSSLFSHYTHLVFSTGCTIPTLHSALPPSHLVSPALCLVHWYTHHPSNPVPPPLDKISHATLIGQGNVSLDIARMLLTNPAILEKYDVPEHVLNVLRRSAVQHVSIVGRRGPLQAAFTTKELREMMCLTEASMTPIEPSLLNPSQEMTRQQTRTMQLLTKGSVNKPGTTRKTWSLDFFRSPTRLVAPTSGAMQLTLAHTSLDERARSVPTGENSTLSTDFVVTSLGHHADPAQTFYEPSTGTIRASSGRVIDSAGRALKNVYASGWAAMGARGVLASTMLDAYAVADTILSDQFATGSELTTMSVPAPAYEEERPMAIEADLESLPNEVEAGIRDCRIMDYEQWKVVDVEEIRRGQLNGKERERMDWYEARKVLDQAK
ncbi:FAD/NAD(P)-binding domain-containing protein [Artomyces pyxidatus]|uniref:FAD/NAD(P)-binding domain-containing protein n=1 Tax=Artomyces pyxidatus TaxID=48021 RepID=A0ACB8TG81_9AGAM|nr:FAD/NAD(P)-binding domain-containing protein [Artomyces pyxidatus]